MAFGIASGCGFMAFGIVLGCGFMAFGIVFRLLKFPCR